VVTFVAGVIPLVLLHVMGDNHNMRLLSPAWIPASGIVILMLHMAGTLTQPLGLRVVALVLAAQAVILAGRVWLRVEGQRDWQQLRTLTAGQPPEEIRIAHLGEAVTLNSPQILHTWRLAGETIDLDRLWRWESGPIQWENVLSRVDSADLVVIPLGLSPVDRQGKTDNVYNMELTRRLLASGNAWGVDTVARTSSDSNSYVVFIRRSP